MLFKEHLPTYTTVIKTDPSLNRFSDSGLYLAEGAITPTLLGLLSIGKDNCCKEILPKEPAKPIQTELFKEEETPVEKPVTPQEKPEKPEKKTEKPKIKDSNNLFGGLFGNFINKGKKAFNELKDNMTEVENDNDNE